MCLFSSHLYILGRLYLERQHRTGGLKEHCCSQIQLFPTVILRSKRCSFWWHLVCILIALIRCGQAVHVYTFWLASQMFKKPLSKNTNWVIFKQPWELCSLATISHIFHKGWRIISEQIGLVALQVAPAMHCTVSPTWFTWRKLIPTLVWKCQIKWGPDYGCRARGLKIHLACNGIRCWCNTDFT